MRLDVLGEMVAAHESFAAFRASEPLFSGVSAEMALKLVGSRKGFAAKEPVADEGPLARVPSKMSLQVGCFAVDLAASGNVANVLLLFRSGLSGSRVLAVGASTPPAPALRRGCGSSSSYGCIQVSRCSCCSCSRGMKKSRQRSVRRRMSVRVGRRWERVVMRIQSVFEEMVGRERWDGALKRRGTSWRGGPDGMMRMRRVRKSGYGR